MPVHRCGVSALCLHELRGGESDEAEEFEYVEIDPTGRYGRYKEVLGKGAFKTVYRAFDQEDGIEVAWNQVQDVLLRTQEDLDRLYSEIHLLNQLKHKNIIKLYHSWVDNKAHTVNFITEIFTSGTLRQYRKRHKHIDIKAVKNWSRQILRGLLYLHSHDPPIIHRDLKCDNIFINGNQGEVKIGDLGLAAILQHAHARSVIGTPEFMAPELYEEEYTELVDIYSFGMCLLEMVTSEYPYSECSNAAQIYKKVLMGKKPEALKLVKYPDLRQLIEKCLAPASKRLPARELLVDPFLQTEGSKTSVEPSSHVGLIVRKTSGMDDLGIISEDPHGISATVQISYVLKETLPGSDLCGCSSGESQTANSKALPNNDSILSHPREDRARSVDFRVNGKRIEDDNIFLKLRISGSEGQVRDIHFPFDVESDTAMCVASEMVAELDLTDQDVTKIAEMIDAAIMALVPEWKPGVAIDETCYEAEVPNVEDDSDVAGFYGVPVEDVAVHSAMVEMMSPSRVEGLMYERFEEVTYQCHRSEYPAHEIEEHDEYPVNEVEGHAEQCTFSSDTTDMSKEAEWSLSDGSGFHASQEVMTSKEAVSPVFEESLLTDLREKDMDTGNAPASFSELVEFKRKSSCTNFVHKIWEGLVHDHPFTESNTTLTTAILHDDDDDDDAYDEEAARELAELFDRYEQEKLELQHRHEAAVEEVKRRHRERKIMKFEDSDNSCHSFCNKLLVRPLERLKFEDRLFEMQQNVQCEHGSMNGSITSLEDLSSIGQDTPRSMSKGSVWQEQRI